MEKIWYAIGKAARKFDTQVIAKTHSYECIQAAHQAFTESENMILGIIDLDRLDDFYRAVTYDREDLEVAMNTEFAALLRHMQIEDIQVKITEGVDKLKAFVKPLCKSRNFLRGKSLVIVRDADDNTANRFTSVCNREM